MVKKVFVILVLLAVMGGALFSADVRYINLNAIKNMNAFSDELNYVLLNQNAMRWWVSDDAWNNPTPKSDVAAVLRTLYGKLCEHEDAENQEYLLLKAVISDFLYNFDEPGFFEVTKENYLAIETLPERDYRYKWFLGTFLGNACKSIEAVDCFRYILDQIPENALVPDLFWDYGNILYQAMMPSSAKHAFDTYALYSGYDIGNNQMYRNVLNLLPEYNMNDVDSIVSDYIFQFHERNGMNGKLSKLYGIWYSPDEEWTLNQSGLTVVKHTEVFNSALISKDGRNITYSVLLIDELTPSYPVCSAADTFESVRQDYSSVSEVQLFPDIPGIRVYELKEPSRYTECGGAHGYAVLVESEYDPDGDCAFEKPFDINASGTSREGGVKYFRAMPMYTRFKGTTAHFILLDSCEAIWEESSSAFLEFLETCEFF